MRSAVYGAAGSGARRRAHLALAHVLDGERRTWHRAAAADGPDPVLAADLEAFAADARHRSAYAAAAAAQSVHRTPEQLLAEVQSLVREMHAVPVEAAAGVFAEEWAIVGRAMAERHPELSEKAMHALSHRWFMSNR